MTDWSSYAEQGRKMRAKIEATRAALPPKEREAFDAEVARWDARRNDAEQDQQAQRNVELAMRRKWAALIREEFGKYHDHSESGGECGACGAIQAANWMDPNCIGDGPTEENR